MEGVLEYEVYILIKNWGSGKYGWCVLHGAGAGFHRGAPERGCTRLILGTVRFKGLEDKYQPSAFSRQLTKNKVLY